MNGMLMKFKSWERTRSTIRTEEGNRSTTENNTEIYFRRGQLRISVKIVEVRL